MEDELYAPDPERWRRVGRRLGWMLATLFLAFGALYLLRAGGLFEPVPLKIADVRLAPSPPYSLARFMSEVQALGELPPVLPPSDGPQFLPLSRALTRHPWILSVDELRYLHSNQVEIAVTYRTPAFELNQEGQKFFLTADGIVLSYVLGYQEQLIPIQGLKLNSKLVPGTQVKAPELKTAAKAAAALRYEWKHWQLIGMEFSFDGVEQTLRLHAAGGSSIVWSSVDGLTSEATDLQKTAWLRDYVKQFGSFEKPNGPYLLDVRAQRLERKNLR